VSIPRRLGRLARGLVSNLQEDERFRETLRTGRERTETLRSAFEAALRGAAEEWRSAEEQRQTRASGERSEGWRPSSTFPEPGKRARAERITAEINASHDTIERHLLRR
jgi:hypothetical protein